MRADRAAQEEFLRKVTRLYRAVSGAVHTADDVETRLKTIREALRETPAAEKQLEAAADALEQRESGDSARAERRCGDWRSEMSRCRRRSTTG